MSMILTFLETGERFHPEHRVPLTFLLRIGVVILLLLVTACGPFHSARTPATSQATPQNSLASPLPVESPESLPTLTLYGPEDPSPLPYPRSFTLETASQAIAAVDDAPEDLMGISDVQKTVYIHTQLARNVGLKFDHMEVKFVKESQRWFLVPVKKDNTIAGWLKLTDSSSQSGWRYAEQPTWDSQFEPDDNNYQYDLPGLHDPANHYEAGFTNGFPVLIEVGPDNKPQYWNDIVDKTVEPVEGAILPTATVEPPTPTLEPTATATPAAPEYYHGLAPTLDGFTEIESVDDISKIIADLRSQPSLLTDGSEPIHTSVAQNNSVAFSCNGSGEINCAVAASVKVKDQGLWRWLYIIELRNSDGTRGYLTGYGYDGVERRGTEGYKRMIASPTGPIIYAILREITPPFDKQYPYEAFNTQKPGIQELIEKFLQSQIVPPGLEDQIVNLVNS
jgi:hypothetical protein